MATKNPVDILLVSLPPWGVDTPPLAPACLSAYLKNKGMQADIFDFNIKLYNLIPEKYDYLWTMNYSHLWRQHHTFHQIQEVLDAYITPLIEEIINHPAPVLGFTLPTNCSDILLSKIIKKLRKKKRSKTLILGGVSVSIKAQRDQLLALLHNNVDYCVVGEGEEVLYEIMQLYVSNRKEEISNVKGVLSKESFHKNILPRIVENLDSLPFATFDDFELKEYKVPTSFVMEFSRGCIGRCPFCDFKSVSPLYQTKSASYIVRQIQHYKEKYHMNHISVCDAAVNAHIKVLGDVCDLLIKANLSVRISALAIPRKEMTEELLKKMKHAGFYRLEYGVESGSNKVLKAMKKIFSADDAETVVRTTHAVGIRTYLYFIVGFPGETQRDFESTKAFLRRTADCITMIKSINPLFLMAGSELFLHHEKYSIVFSDVNPDTDWSIPKENNTRQTREKRVYELKRLVEDLQIAFTEEAECSEFTKDVLKSKEDREAISGKVDVLLLNIPWIEQGKHGVRAGSRWPHVKDQPENEYLPFPFFLAYATSLLKKHAIQAKLLDAIAEGLSIEDTLHAIEEYDPSYIVIETSTVTLHHDIAFMKSMPRKHKIIFVGPEVHIWNEEFLKKNVRVDFTIKGEYEYALLELIKAFKSNQSLELINGLRFRKGNNIVVNPDRPLCRIDDLPWPERRDVPLDRYNDTPGNIPMPSVQMLASRGCPFGCIFCLWPSVMYGGRNYRNRHYVDVVDEMEFLVKKGFKSIYFDDDTFGLDREWAIKFCQEIIKRNKYGRINVPWAMMTRADCLDVEVLRLMKEAGLMAVKYGVETASPDLLRIAGKEYDRIRMEYIIKETKRLKIKVHLTFTFGLPGETHRSAKDTIFYAIHLNPDSVQFSITTPFPGTKYYEDAKRMGTLISEDWTKYDGNYHSVIKTDQLSPQQLVDYKNRAYLLWGIFSRFRHRSKLLFQLSCIYIYMQLLEHTQLSGIVNNYLNQKFVIVIKIFKWFLYLMKPIEQRLRCLGIFHGERAFIGPSLMQIDLTNDCNNDCIGCWCNSPLLEERRLTPAEKNVHISFPVVKQLIDDAAAMKTKEVYLAGGGEPFMYRDIMEVIRYIKRRGMCLYINTNFTLLDVPRIHELIGLGVEHLTVSIWAGTPSVYCKTHPNKDAATFIRLENMLKYLQSLKPFHQSPYVKIYNVISNLNYHELDYMYDFALRTKSHSVEFTVIDTIPGKTDVLMLNKQQMSELRAAAVKLKQRVEQLRLDGQTPPILFRYEQFLRRISDSDCVEGNYDKNIINRIPCSVGWNFTRVVPNGDVNGCLKAHRIPVGNINTDSFKNIWNSPAQRYFRKKTYTLEKKDRFFSMIGNDPRAAVGCFKGCDDLGRNEFLDRAVKKLSIIEKNLLKGIAQLCRFIDYLRNKKFIKGKKYEINTFPARALREKSFEPEQDLELRGIAHGYRAYKGPTHVVVDLTNRCNNTCLGCWMYSPLLEEKKVISSWAKAELSERDVIRLIKDLKDMGTEIIRFTGGGEPLLHKSFSKIVRFAKKSGLKVAVTTSLPYVHRSVIEALLLSDELAISLWAANADVYQLMHPNQSKKHFKWIEDTLRSIQTTANRYQEITLCHVLTNKNYKNVNEMITFAQKIGIRRLYFTLIDPIEGKTDTLLLNDNQRQWLYAYLQSVNGEQLNGVIIENYNGLIERLREAGNVQHGNYDGRVIDSLPCYIGWHFSRIVANGDVVPCCRGVKKRIGNIKEKRFKWIWNSLSQQEFRNNALRLSKFDPYFEKIECYKTCDNLMQNKVIHQRWISRAK